VGRDGRRRSAARAEHCRDHAQARDGGQPSRDTLARLREQGFGAVIYLAPPTVHDAVQDEPVILNRQSIAFVNIPIEFERPTEADYETFAQQMKKLGDRKLLVHCQANLRASSMVFLHRVIALKEDPHKAYGAVSSVWMPNARGSAIFATCCRSAVSRSSPISGFGHAQILQRTLSRFCSPCSRSPRRFTRSARNRRTGFRESACWRSARRPTRWSPQFIDGLRDLGYVEGRNVVIERRYGTGAVDKYPELIAEMIRLGVDVIVVGGAVARDRPSPPVRRCPSCSRRWDDPVAAGLVASLSRPNGNATGVSNIVAELSAKQLELLKLASPGISRVAVLHNPLNSAPSLVAARAGSVALGLQLQLVEVRRPSEIAVGAERGSVREGRRDSGALGPRDRQRADPTCADGTDAANAGDLLAERVRGTRRPAGVRSRLCGQLRARRSVCRQDTQGGETGDAPVEQPTRFELVVNLKTAKALGLQVPSQLLQRADRFIE
jgi:putative ABC transport system substrate-binding protein